MVLCVESCDEDIINLKDSHAEDLPQYIHINQNEFFMRR